MSPGYANNPDKIVNGLPPVHHTEPVEDGAQLCSLAHASTCYPITRPEGLIQHNTFLY